MNRHFISTGFNHEVIADDLIHELFHGTAQTDDVGYASDAGLGVAGGQLLDVAPLLNLASGRLRSGQGAARHDSSKTFENADSLAIATSLLSQLITDKNSFDTNMAIMESALDDSGDDAITEPVLITLNK